MTLRTFMHYCLELPDLLLSRKFLCKKGKKTVIRRGCFFDRPSRVIIGNNSFINRNCQFHVGASTGISIGSNTFLAMNVTLICISHSIGTAFQRAGYNTYASISIGNGVWIGANTTILPGVCIGNGSIIAAGSVVARSIGMNELWGGVPAKLIRKLD